MNVDVAFPSEIQAIAFGMCIRDEHGRVVHARTSWVPMRLDIKEGEAMGLLEAINWALQLNLHNVIFELDGKIVVDSLKAHTVDISEYGSVI